MLSKTTARKIFEVCEQIDDCKKALAMLKGKGKTPFFPIVSVTQSEDDEGVNILLLHDFAKGAIEAQLIALEAEYKALNTDAQVETNV